MPEYASLHNTPAQKEPKRQSLSQRRPSGNHAIRQAHFRMKGEWRQGASESQRIVLSVGLGRPWNLSTMSCQQPPICVQGQGRGVRELRETYDME